MPFQRAKLDVQVSAKLPCKAVVVRKVKNERLHAGSTVLANSHMRWTVIADAPDGRPRVYELDFGRGYKIITHVFWVPGNGRR
jgi:hypothetical protein